MDRTPKSGEFYRHFKDKLYQVITVAEHTETGEALVVYQALYDDYRTYARPLAMFTSEVDRQKYPEAVQKYRFERVIFPSADHESAPAPAGRNQETGVPDALPKEQDSAHQEHALNPHLLTFIEAETYEERVEALNRMRGKVSQEDLDIICVALDMKRTEGSVEEQLYGIEQCIRMQRHYDGGRLR